MTYNIRVATFTDGVTTFTAMPANGVNVKSGSADGPRVITHMVENDAGAIIDLDGTGAATLVPPIVEQNLIFTGNHPDAHTQYKNLMTLKGEHGTFNGWIPNDAGNRVVSVAARLIEVTGNWEGSHKAGTANWLAVKAVWQLKGFI